MRILDLDMDLFQSERVDRRPRGINKRIDGDLTFGHITPWSEDAVRQFLEEACGLNKELPIPTYYVTHHAQVFDIWRDLIASGGIKKPFSVVHADAHADLSYADLSFDYIVRDLLHLPPEKRINPKLFTNPTTGKDDQEGVDDGNYLLFAIACRWISDLTYVHHPSCDDDIMLTIFDEVPDVGIIQLQPRTQSEMESDQYWRTPAVGIKEPPVDFYRFSADKYVNSLSFDIAFVAQSPTYTSTAVDGLYPIICEYLKPELGFFP